MTPSTLLTAINQMTDNMMNSVSSKEQKKELIQEFRTWMSLSFAAGLIETDDYETIRRYGECKIEENFKEW